MGRKPEAKPWPEEHEAHEANIRWARGLTDPKPDVIQTGWTYMRQVYGAKVTRFTTGDLLVCQRLGSPGADSATLQGAVTGESKSAEAIVAAGAWRLRAEHEEPNRLEAFDG
ncbi:MAG: hypothetical protein HY815_24650 [Candidatus Riflebacteria bacterium]|nr:hypothetical protein [Candidatus Riflebacteria bacterium]